MFKNLDLTPLLDVILILLFVFMMQLSLREESTELENQKLKEENAKLKKSFNQVIEIMYENEANIKKLIAKTEYNKLENLEKELTESFNEETLFEDLIKYNAVIDNFIQFDLSLATENNIFSINDSQKLELNPESQEEIDTYSKQLQTKLADKLDLRRDDSEKYLLLLAIKDEYVSLNAYRIISRAVKELEEDFPENIFVFADYYIASK